MLVSFVCIVCSVFVGYLFVVILWLLFALCATSMVMYTALWSVRLTACSDLETACQHAVLSVFVS